MSGIGNAILNPYNDSRVNLLLAMTHPANNQKIETTNAYYWDVTSFPIRNPFYIQAILPLDTTEENSRLIHNQFIELLHELDLNENSLNSKNRVSHTHKGQSLVPLADRALNLYKILQNDSKLSKIDRKQIISYLLQLIPNESATANTKVYFDYITATNVFYEDDYNKAELLFSSLARSGSGWIKEASLYNLIRIEIRKTLRQSADRYGFFDIEKIDQTQAHRILPAIQRYLSAFPKGQFIDSAKNLKRCAYWLTNDKNNLLKSYSDAINAMLINNDFIAAAKLSAEIENKYLFDDLNQIEWTVPVIATTKILIRLRKSANDERNEHEPVKIEEIKSHESDFKQHKAISLYQYLLTAYTFFEDANYEKVVQETESWKTNLAQADYAGFSRASLRAEALGKLKRWQDQAILLKELKELSPSPLLRDHFELAQAQNLEKSGNLRKIFEPNSIIQSPSLKRRVLTASADTHLLEYVIEQKHITPGEKSIALATLLNKELHGKKYKSLLEHQNKYASLKLDDVNGLDFLRNETVNSDDNLICPKWSDVLKNLSSNKVSPHSLLCLGERLRTLEDHLIIDSNSYNDELGESNDGFDTKSLTRLSLYLTVINDTHANDDDKAFALRRALYCFASSGNNHCGTEEISEKQRKEWFYKLKSKYKKSPWAIKQKYYW